jgi:osmotically inducible protein OsmC
MADLLRNAEAEWNGDLRSGKGHFSASSGVFKDVPYSFSTRFENAPGSNPEELIAAAHAACFSMAFANVLTQKGYQPEHIHTQATCVMSPKQGGGFRIAKMRLQAEGRVPKLDQATFQQIAEEAEKGCPVSVLLRPGLDEVTVEAKLA